MCSEIMRGTHAQWALVGGRQLEGEGLTRGVPLGVEALCSPPPGRSAISRCRRIGPRPRGPVRFLVGSARPGTVRLRVRTWEPFAWWFWLKKGKNWPQNPMDIVESVQERVFEAAPASWPMCFVACLV